MFSHRGLFLAVTISLASIVLAGVLYQPGYEHQYNSNSRYLQDQSAPQYWTQSPIEQHRAEQLPTRYRPGVQTVYPYESNQVNARSSEPINFPPNTIFIPWPIYPQPGLLYLDLLKNASKIIENEDPKEARRETVEDYEKIIFRRGLNGGRSLQPLMVHNRRKRSDPASTESEVVAHDNDVAAKSPSTDAKHPATIDSLLPEHEPTDTTDKRVENRQIRNDYITNPFGFYTEDTHPEHTYNIPNKWQSMIDQYYTNRHSEPPNVAQGKACCDDYNKPLMRFAQSSSSQKSNDNDYSSKYRDSAADTEKETFFEALLKKLQLILIRPDIIVYTPY
ncbi:uncharacterized protein LOC112452407 [Temnothorax curvispinosus]|uniref:Uncharacterized protein LOC112452407 n=1 Tax=Temnothorax curvispinosus TaxID=300111 RepID=A0A6J1PG24_9HYME|nr:uncharacterized protein LOC112452407 [Temnothorax curvispinosus]